MTRYALIIALGVLCAALGWVAMQSRTISALDADNARLARSNAALTMKAEQNAMARDVARAAAARQASIAAKAQGDVEAILTGDFGECADANLPDDLRDILSGMRPTD
tara:strand:- start:639 stop:962 length:324 start_codon:yes stop_codon:yes gene_type:complete